MPDSPRELALKACRSNLELESIDFNGVVTSKPAGLKVHRYFTRGATGEDLPDQTLYIADEDPTNDLTGVSERRLAIRLRSRAHVTQSVSGDEALDELLTWGELALMHDIQLGGAAVLVEYNGLAVDAEERADVYAEAFQEFVITYQTVHRDPRTKP